MQQLAARLRTYQLVDFFSQVGPVKEAQIVKDRVSNRSKGVGYVESVGCSAGKYNFKGVFTYTNNTPSQTIASSQKCS